MGQWKKSSEKLVEQFLEATDALPKIEKRKMFGYPCCFLNGNMFTGLHEENWIVRLDEEDREKLKSLGGSLFEPMKGRPMREYVTLPKSVLTSLDELAHWLERSHAFVNSMPPKVKKKKKN